jgi:hypothetical protein
MSVDEVADGLAAEVAELFDCWPLMSVVPEAAGVALEAAAPLL